MRTPSNRGAEAFVATPFQRLARTHALNVAGDALISIALAGSLFFSIDPGAARGRVTLYLVLTMAPFALIAPLVGPAIDRAAGGRRWMVVLASGLRVIVAALMMRHIDSLLLFPEAFAALVLGKGYHVAKSALVPTLVTHRRELVEANSKLVVISGLAGLVAAVPGVLLFQIGPEWVLLLAVVAFGLATVAATRVPRTTVAAEPVDELERTELRGIGVLLAASAMGVVRAVVGFMTFLLAFWLKDEGAAAIWFGVLVGASLVGTFTGALLAPRLRRFTREENLLLAVILATTLMAAFTGVVGGRTAAGLLAFTVGIAASAGKLAFDAIVQRDAPDANQGRSFAKFETRFQLAWVAGALIPAVLPLNVLPVRAGFVVIAAVLAFAGFTYFTSLRAVARGERPLPNPVTQRVTAWRRRLVPPMLREWKPRALPWRRTNDDAAIEVASEEVDPTPRPAPPGQAPLPGFDDETQS